LVSDDVIFGAGGKFDEGGFLGLEEGHPDVLLYDQVLITIRILELCITEDAVGQELGEGECALIFDGDFLADF
jgi:hypothetical protein